MWIDAYIGLLITFAIILVIAGLREIGKWIGGIWYD